MYLVEGIIWPRYFQATLLKTAENLYISVFRRVDSENRLQKFIVVHFSKFRSRFRNTQNENPLFHDTFSLWRQGEHFLKIKNNLKYAVLNDSRYNLSSKKIRLKKSFLYGSYHTFKLTNRITVRKKKVFWDDLYLRTFFYFFDIDFI